MERQKLLKSIPKKLPLAIALAINSMCVNAQFNATEELSGLNGSNGFVMNGVLELDLSGRSVSAAGDVNGDGLDDVIIGATGVDTNGSSSGASYVVFGSGSQFNASLNLSALDGSNGFVIDGVDINDNSGFSVSAAGDINGDDFDDIIIGATGVNTNGSNSGASYVVFGSGSFNSSLDLSTLNGSNGFLINGTSGGDRLGNAVSSAGDINGDGFDDLIVAAYEASTTYSISGVSYVVFGSNSFNSSLDLSTLNGSNGFQLNGPAQEGALGNSVSEAGDVNGDGLDDIIIGAYFVDANGTDSGASYVVFGSLAVFSSPLDLTALNGSNGFVINGVTTKDYSGSSVSSAGDINGDGIDDLIIGAYKVDTNGTDSGASYVVFGSQSFNSSLNLSSLNGSNGFVINGVTAGDQLGESVSAAGDVNGDGLDDIILGATTANTNGLYSGASYVVFGKDNFNPTLDLSTLNGSNGFLINGVTAGDRSGKVSSAGDVNGDGVDDVIIGASEVDTNGNASGASYVLFGNDVIFTDGFEVENQTPTNNDPEVAAVIPNQAFQDADVVTYPTAFGFTDADGDMLSYGATGLPTGLSINPSTGLISGTADHSASQGGTAGVYSVVVFADDGNDGTPAQQTISYTLSNPAPNAIDDTNSGNENTVIIGDVSTNDSDPDGDSPLAYSKLTDPAHGNLVFNNDGTYTYLPESNNNTDVSFTYQVSDGEGGTDTATVSIVINPII